MLRGAQRMRHVVVGRLLAPLLLVALLAAGPLRAQPAAEPTPDQVKSLLQLLADPVVKTWIAREIHSPAVGASTAAPAPRESVETEVATIFEAGLADLRERVRALAAAVPDLPGELVAAEDAPVRRSGIDRLAAGAAAARGVRRLRLRLRAGLPARDCGVPRAAHGLTPGYAGRARAGGAGAPALRARHGGDVRRGQYRRLPRLLLAGQPPRRRPGLFAGLPGAAGGNDRRPVPVRAAEPPLSRGADGRRRGLALVPLGGGLRRLVRVRLRHHPAAAPLRRRRARGPDHRLSARAGPARHRAASDLAQRRHCRRPQSPRRPRWC